MVRAYQGSFIHSDLIGPLLLVVVRPEITNHGLILGESDLKTKETIRGVHKVLPDLTVSHAAVVGKTR